ncbi:MAG: hypothetical protein V4657_09455 [Pseudomonadota bacterium]
MAGPALQVDENLLQFATPRQREVLEAIRDYGSARKAGSALGTDINYPSAVYKAVQKRAAKQGYAPEHDYVHAVPDGFVAKGVSTYYNSEGKPAGQWVKSTIDAERQRELMMASVEAMCLNIKPVAPIAAPKAALEHLLQLYPFYDYHVGMHAWHKEGGADWDLKIAEETGLAAMQSLVASAPMAGTAIIDIGGDWMHYDGHAPITPTHGHILDADGRFAKMVDVSIRLIRQMVSLALQKHSNVTLLIQEGNHDLASSLWLRKMFACLYEGEPRVTVHESELPYYAIQWGNTMLGFHHGHLKKWEGLPLLFAAQFAAIWGATHRRYIHTGHRHHKLVREFDGVQVIQHQTMAAPDAHSSRGGYHSERGLMAVTYHAKYGEVATTTLTPQMLEAA